ncbi:ArsR/SmtB family transcription factor [Calditerricola satsumensis]|uniref:ArsR/SmtB family transcription factor n=1 Tax=Calditerricola satsumensis TaxID=373054 RepID=UPI0009F89684|nr:metalloregulator ArsR/SmtB family transcription factor [Calditerricola satsumensis]
MASERLNDAHFSRYPNRTKADTKTDTCNVFIYDAEKVSRLRQMVDRVRDLAPLFKVLSDETRLKIVYALTLEDELCVCDVAAIIGSSTAAASHHLRLLRNMGLATYRREGKMVFYRLQSLRLAS